MALAEFAVCSLEDSAEAHLAFDDTNYDPMG
jgi:hypothetical protein